MLMNLESFRIRNFRSINDSGDIDVSRITALLGRNESGKTTLLIALNTLNPAEGFKALNPTKDFPRHRRLTECSDDTEVVSTSWRLTPDERKELGQLLPRAESLTHVRVGRRYGANKGTWVGLDLPALEFNEANIQNKVSKIVAAVKVASETVDADKATSLVAAADAFSESLAKTTKMKAWASNASPALATLRQAIVRANATLTENQEQDITGLESLARSIGGDDEAQQKARSWVAGKLPIFIYLDEYPALDGHQNVNSYVQRKNQNQQTEADHGFEKLCKVAGLDPTLLHKFQGEAKIEERGLLTNRASAVVTNEIRRLWKDRTLKVRFQLDGEHFETLISDPTSTYDVEVNLDERSRGFKWFFSFYITFSADTDGGRANNAILLLDEPGHYLHIQSQKDLQDHFENDFDNQIIYTTHSPFMVPIQTLDRVRTVNVAEDTGTTVTNDPTGDGRTLAPLRAALGYHYVDTLLIAPNNLIVEGVTDWWILEAISKHFISVGKLGLPTQLALPPADGVTKVPERVSFLTSHKLVVLVLLDDESQARAIRDQIISSKLIREENVLLISDVFETNKPPDADIEDLIDPFTYEALARESYAKELTGRTLTLNAQVPRIVKRLEAAFRELDLNFNKTRVAGLFFRKMAADPINTMTEQTRTRFEALFRIIGERLQKSIERRAEPFR
jgi:ABC-type cobalamin/Fe3+-siderophores transport system ATPase subunit